MWWCCHSVWLQVHSKNVAKWKRCTRCSGNAVWNWLDIRLPRIGRWQGQGCPPSHDTHVRVHRGNRMLGNGSTYGCRAVWRRCIAPLFGSWGRRPMDPSQWAVCGCRKAALRCSPLRCPIAWGDRVLLPQLRPDQRRDSGWIWCTRCCDGLLEIWWWRGVLPSQPWPRRGNVQCEVVLQSFQAYGLACL